MGLQAMELKPLFIKCLVWEWRALLDILSQENTWFKVSFQGCSAFQTLWCVYYLGHPGCAQRPLGVHIRMYSGHALEI